MKNVTLSADERLIALAREKAEKRRTTLNAEFREWLVRYVGSGGDAESRVRSYRQLMASLSDIAPGARFTRDDANER